MHKLRKQDRVCSTAFLRGKMPAVSVIYDARWHTCETLVKQCLDASALMEQVLHLLHLGSGPVLQVSVVKEGCAACTVQGHDE